MKYLVDTNIWLERLLDQERSNDVEKLFNETPSDELCISDFSLHSIGVIMNRFKKGDDFVEFIDDLFSVNQVNIVSLSPIELKDIVEVIKYQKLDFDDAYQFKSAKNIPWK